MTKPPVNQQELNVQQRNGLASFPLSQGADLKECLVFIDALIKRAGANAVSSILGQKLVAKKWEGISQLYHLTFSRQTCLECYWNLGLAADVIAQS